MFDISDPAVLTCVVIGLVVGLLLSATYFGLAWRNAGLQKKLFQARVEALMAQSQVLGEILSRQVQQVKHQQFVDDLNCLVNNLMAAARQGHQVVAAAVEAADGQACVGPTCGDRVEEDTQNG